ncbi:MAG: GNAT family N-acetyltransferase [Cyanobacteria bacterium J06623_7]
MTRPKVEILISSLTLEDVNDVARLKRSSISQLNSLDYSKKQIQVLINSHSFSFNADEISSLISSETIQFPALLHVQNDSGANIVARIENEIVGYASLGSLSPFENFQTLQELFVHPQYIRRGVGTKLLQV